MSMYCGIDLHSNNNYVAIQDAEHKDVACRRLRNELGAVLSFLEPYRSELVRLAVESTYNWYWLVDGLQEAAYDVRLVNTTRAQVYSGLKYTDDKHDARWIALLLALGILPEGYIMPVAERGLRDLLRQRSFLVQRRTSHIQSLRAIYSRNTGRQLPGVGIHDLDLRRIRLEIDKPFVFEALNATVPVIRVLDTQIKAIEKSVEEVAKIRDEYQLLQTAPGLGKILALTIMCETGDIGRFPAAGNYVSYCRCAKAERTSNSKKKGAGNRKNGNKYLSWAYSEVAHHAVRVAPLAKRYYDKKRSRCHQMVAARSVASKMARACYYVLRNQVPFDVTRTFHR